MDISQLKKIIRGGGVVGAGGAGFPSYQKLDSRTETLILNCAECEPLLKLHRCLLEKHTAEILEAFGIISGAVGAKRAVIAVKETSHKAVESVSSYIKKSGFAELRLLPDFYPAGDEAVLTYEVTKKIVKPGELPISVGVTVFNTETVYNIYRAVNGFPVTHKYVTVAGEVKKPVTLKVPVGTSVSDAVKFAGGLTTDCPAYILGGPMMGRRADENSPITKTTNGILVLPKEHMLVMAGKRDTERDMRRARAVCCLCGYCTDMCPRALLGHPIKPDKFMLYASNNTSCDTKAYLDTLFCSGCGVCELYACQQGLSPRGLMLSFKERLLEKGVTAPKYEGEPQALSAREYAKVPMHRLKSRLGISEYDSTHALLDESGQAVNEVHIPLEQHIGVPARATVKKGDRMVLGQVIAKVPDESLGVDIHASIDGTVEFAGDMEIVIVRSKGIE